MKHKLRKGKSPKKEPTANKTKKVKPWGKPQDLQRASDTITPMSGIFSKKPLPAEQKSAAVVSWAPKLRPTCDSLDKVAKPITSESPKSSVVPQQKSALDIPKVAQSQPTQKVVTIPKSGSLKTLENVEQKSVLDIPQVTKSEGSNGCRVTLMEPVNSELGVEEKSARDIPQVTKPAEHNGSLEALTRPDTSESPKRPVVTDTPRVDESQPTNGSPATLAKPVAPESLKRSLDVDPLVQDNNIKQQEEMKNSFIV